MDIGERLTGAPLRGADLARAAVRLWRSDAASLQPVSDSDNQVYRVAESGRPHYLRLTPSFHRSADQIGAELDFINHLHRNGVSAMPPVASAAGRLVETIPAASGCVFACVFEEAPGERLRYDAARLNKEHFRLRGRTLGQIHAFSKAYLPAARVRRFAWNEDKLLQEANNFLPRSEAVVWYAYEEVTEWLRGCAKTGDNYGLVHGDFGETNYRCSGSRLNLFDFDDCCYHWFAYDLAVAIYPHGWRKEGLQLLDALLEGYSEYMPVEVTRAEITMFCQWRLIYLFLSYARRWGVGGLRT